MLTVHFRVRRVLLVLWVPPTTYVMVCWAEVRSLRCHGLWQVEGEAKSLKKVTQALEGRTQALTDQLAEQRADFSQRLFEAQQEVNEVCSIFN